MTYINLIATSAFGLEAVVARELRQLGYNEQTVFNGGVRFTADLEAIPRCNLWLRTADRLLIEMGHFKAGTFEELFQQTKALPWSDWLPANAEFPVIGKSVNSQLFSVPSCQAVTKKAVVESLRQTYKIEQFPEDGPFYRIQVALLKDMVTLTLGTSGTRLHQRGYRLLNSPAPLRETLAAALVLLSRWKPDRAFIDPCCGSGTIPIEAALIARNIAPGINRSFAAEKWENIPAYYWEKARTEARDSIIHEQPLGIMGFDINPEVLKLARFHAQNAGFGQELNFQSQDLGDLKSRYQYGYLIANPPYGERLSESTDVEKLSLKFKKLLKAMPTWSFYILTAQKNLETIMERRADKRRKLYNGRIECTYFQYFGEKPKNLAGPFSLPSKNEQP